MDDYKKEIIELVRARPLLWDPHNPDYHNKDQRNQVWEYIDSKCLPAETFFTCLLFVMLGVVFQAIKFIRHQYGRRCRNTKCKRYILSKGHLLQTLMYIVQFVWGYCLMLSVMTYNVWLLISVLSGFGIGYLFFGWGEYEDSVAVQRLRPDSCGIECKATCSTTTTQELLLNDEADIAFKQIDEGDGIMKCNCDDSEL